MSLLEVSDLAVGFHMPGRDALVVDHINFTVEHGETLAIVGESGSGKTQSVFAMMGLLARNGFASGSVKFDGQELVGRNEAQLNKIRATQIAMIFQDPMTSLNPYMRIGEQLVEVLTLHKGISRHGASAEAIRMLDAVKLPDARGIFTRFPHECSGGMRQRIMIAMALLCRPKLLIADEPTTALDVTVQAQMLELFKGLTVEFGTALIIITHDLGVVAGLADRMLVMYAGRIVEVGAIDDLFYEPAHPYTLGLLNSTPSIEHRARRLNSINGSPPDLEHLPDGCAFNRRCRFRFDRCFSERPVLTATRSDRAKACFYGGPLVRDDREGAQ